MKEEENVFNKAGKDNHFVVPDHYFENFTSQMMERLSDIQREPVGLKKPARWDTVKPWIYMAAMFIGAALIIRVLSFEGSPSSNENINTVTHTDVTNASDNASDVYIDEMLDMSMMDDYLLYVYLTDVKVEY
ncbi:hypothetical protein EZS27_020594 [termite gut metagenome]|uniref:Uncharacterized protein n=1 Tax=termite gut metagenome TaxID=433724 RepID=A0A5J4RCZ3_9ZZZZ